MRIFITMINEEATNEGTKFILMLQHAVKSYQQYHKEQLLTGKQTVKWHLRRPQIVWS